MGAVKTAGRGREVEDSGVKEKVVMVSNVAASTYGTHLQTQIGH
jgi:hypothetical protein